MTRYYKGLRKYNNLIRSVCRVDDYNTIPDGEWEGCLGVACIISIIEGVETTLYSLTDHLEIPYDDNKDLKKVFDRLRINGIFSPKYRLKEDKNLQSQGEKVEVTRGGKKVQLASAVDVERNAWCTVAGVAGGFIGIQ